MNILAVKFYQAIYLGIQQKTHVNIETHPDIKLELVDGIGVQITHKQNISIVPFANLQYIQLTKGSVVTKKAAKA